MKVTSEELRAGRLAPERVELLVTAFEVAGMAAIEGAVPTEVLADIRTGIHRHIDGEHGYITFRTLEGEDTRAGASFFPFEPPFSAPQIVANPILLQVVRAIAGGDVVCRIYNSNLSLPGSLSQPVHVDVPTLDDQGAVEDSSFVSVHVLLTDFTSENGSTEIWPGTQRHPTRKDDLEGLARLAPELPSVRTNHPAGTITLRHPGAWHRGNANRTQESRDMLSLFFAPRGSAKAEQSFGRPLDIRPEILDSMPEEARSVWDVNLGAMAAEA